MAAMNGEILKECQKINCEVIFYDKITENYSTYSGYIWGHSFNDFKRKLCRIEAMWKQIHR